MLLRRSVFASWASRFPWLWRRGLRGAGWCAASRPFRASPWSWSLAMGGGRYLFMVVGGAINYVPPPMGIPPVLQMRRLDLRFGLFLRGYFRASVSTERVFLAWASMPRLIRGCLASRRVSVFTSRQLRGSLWSCSTAIRRHQCSPAGPFAALRSVGQGVWFDGPPSRFLLKDAAGL